LAALLALAGVVIPQEVEISLGAGARFTPGRMAAVVLFFPALLELFKKGRRLLMCDFLALATSVWMIVASVSSAGVSAVPTAAGEAIDFLGGYLIARAYFFGRPAVDTFVRVLKVFAIIVIIFAVADSISGRLITHDIFSAIYGARPYYGELRNGWVRATSTFPHPILFGIFCALTAGILLYWERNVLRRIVAVGLCFLGCIVSRSSAALMVFSIIVAVFTFDRMMKGYSWRWAALWIFFGSLTLAVFAVTEHPLSWILSHLTLDPQTGFYRIMIWDVAFTYIALSPAIGYAYQLVDNWILDATVDSIWLVYALRFGVPMVILFFLTNVAAFFPRRRQISHFDMDQMRCAFTIILLMFMFAGITVHFWNYMLMFWGLCLGIRASLREAYLAV